MQAFPLNEPIETILKTLSSSGDDATFGDAFVRLSKSLNFGEDDDIALHVDQSSLEQIRAAVQRLLCAKVSFDTDMLATSAYHIMKHLSYSEPITQFESALMGAISDSERFELAARIVGLLASDFPEYMLDLFIVAIDIMVEAVRTTKVVSEGALREMSQAYSLPEFAFVFRKLSPPLIDILVESLSDVTQEARFNDLCLTLSNLVALPKFHSRPELETLIGALLRAVSNPHRGVWTDHASVLRPLGLICALMREQPPSCDLMNPTMIKNVVDCSLQLLSQQHMMEDAQWDRVPDVKMSLSISEEAEEIFDDFCQFADSDEVFSVLMPAVAKNLNMKGEANWPQRAGALLALMQSFESLGEELLPNLGGLVSTILPHLSDLQPRVRCVAISALGQMLADFQEDFANDYHDVVVPLLIPLLDDPFLKVRSVVLAFFVSFFNEVEDDAAHSYATTIMPKLMEAISVQSLTALSSMEVELLLQYLTCTSSVSVKSGENMHTYYDQTIAALKSILIMTDPTTTTYTLEEDVELRIRTAAIEAISFICEAVGLDGSRADIPFVMDHTLKKLPEPGLLTKFFHDSSNESESLRSQVLKSSIRLATQLQENFVPYLPLVMPLLLETANMPQSDFLFITYDIEEAERMCTKPGTNMVVYGSRAIVVNGNVLDDKLNATRLIALTLDSMGPMVTEYLPEIHDTFKELLSLDYADNLRATAAAGFTLLVSVTQQICRESEGDTQMVSDIYDSFLSATSAAVFQIFEPKESLEVLIDEMVNCTSELPADLLSPEHMKILVNVRDYVSRLLDEEEQKVTSELSPAEEAAHMELEQLIYNIRESLEGINTILTDNVHH